MRWTTTIFLAMGLFSSLSSAQDTSKAMKYTDAATGISFAGIKSTGYGVGIALPTTPGTDVIIQLTSANISAGGWVGLVFGSSMSGPLQLAAWPNGDKVMISPRQSHNYNAAPVYTKQALTLTPIAAGTSVNSTNFMATFLCGGCLNADSFTAANSSVALGYAWSKDKLADPSNVNGSLNDHSGNPFGSFNLDVADAKNDKYASWAAMASGGSASGSVAPTTSVMSSSSMMGSSTMLTSTKPPMSSSMPSSSMPSSSMSSSMPMSSSMMSNATMSASKFSPMTSSAMPPATTAAHSSASSSAAAAARPTGSNGTTTTTGNDNCSCNCDCGSNPKQPVCVCSCACVV